MPSLTQTQEKKTPLQNHIIQNYITFTNNKNRLSTQKQTTTLCTPIIKTTMTKTHPPTLTTDNVPHNHPPLALLTNVKPPTADDQQHAPTNKPTTTIKTMKPPLPHPCSIEVLPSPANKWSATTHPING
jgi:hypothetical protein